VLRVGASHYSAERPRPIDDLLATARARVGSERLGRRPPSPVASEAAVS
jgi:hypothetical protein